MSEVKNVDHEVEEIKIMIKNDVAIGCYELIDNLYYKTSYINMYGRVVTSLADTAEEARKYILINQFPIKAHMGGKITIVSDKTIRSRTD